MVLSPSIVLNMLSSIVKNCIFKEEGTEMIQGLVRHGLVLCVVLLLLSVGIMPVAVSQRSSTPSKEQARPAAAVSGDLDSWPTFHHDLRRTGVSSLSAPETNDLLWVASTNYWVESAPAVVDGRVYVTSEDYALYCFDAFSGEVLWTFQAHDVIVTSPTVADGKVYFGSLDMKIYCVDANDGSLVWYRVTGWVIAQSSPAYYEDRIYIGGHDKKLYCLDADNGSTIWTYLTDEWISSSPAIVDGKVYFGNMLGNVYCLDAETGMEIWVYPIGWAVWVSSPTIVDGLLYIGACDYKLYCLNAVNGSLVWSFESGDWFAGTAAVLDGRVYIGSIDSNIYCFDAQTGDVIWSYLAGGPVFSSPAIADGKLYVGCDDGNLYCLRLKTGEVVWQYQTGLDVSSSPAIAYGKVYVASMNYKVYCFGQPGQPPVARFSWSPQAPKPGQTISFDASESTDPDGSIVLYEWDWESDGVFDEESASPLASHVWMEAGNYTVTLRVMDNNSDVGAVTKTIEVVVPDTTPPTVSLDSPKEGSVSVFWRGDLLFKIQSRRTVVVGGFDVIVSVQDNQSGVDRVEFFLDGELQGVTAAEPYVWEWPTRNFKSFNLTVAAYDKAGNRRDVSIALFKIL
jgi:outer membrane protein assembly factor BamB